MDYIEIEVCLNPVSEEIVDIYIAELAELGCDSFENTEKGLKAYMPEKYFNLESVSKLIHDNRFNEFNPSFSYTLIKAQNWNAVWESNFEPIIIGDKLLVKAPFHNIDKRFPFVIEIEPKMSFGTGHHETTSSILELMLDKDFKDAKLLDMGTGTGILAIFAKMLGAADVTAIDIDEWAYENCLENIERNNFKDIKVLMGDSSKIPTTVFDIIIANINRNVLLEDIKKYTRVLKNNGLLYLSGFYKEDIPAIEAEANKNGLSLKCFNEKKNWVACIFEKES